MIKQIQSVIIALAVLGGWGGSLVAQDSFWKNARLNLGYSSNFGSEYGLANGAGFGFGYFINDFYFSNHSEVHSAVNDRLKEETVWITAFRAEYLFPIGEDDRLRLQAGLGLGLGEYGSEGGNDPSVLYQATGGARYTMTQYTELVGRLSVELFSELQGLRPTFGVDLGVSFAFAPTKTLAY